MSEWIHYLVPFLLGVGLCTIYICNIPFQFSIRVTGLLFVTMTGTIAFGYFINDWSDIETDRLAGKHNLAASNSTLKNILIVTAAGLIAFLPWLFLPRNPLNTGFYAIQILLLIIYSVKPIRLKRFPLVSFVTDACYNTVVPLFIVIFTLLPDPHSGYVKDSYLVLPVLIIWGFTKGIRGILLHQLADRKNDRRSGIPTFAIRFGPVFTNNFISKILLPFEFLLLALLLCLLSADIPGIFWVLVAFVLYTGLKYRLWNIRWIPLKNYRLYFRFTMNDFYEEWLTLYILILLSCRNRNYIPVLLIYSILFPKFFIRIIRDFPGIIHDLGTDLKYKFMHLKK